MFGKEWQKVQQHVYTRTSTQARSHAQKFFVKLDKKHLILADFLETLDIEKLRVDLRLADGGDSTEYDEDQVIFDTSKPNNKNWMSNVALSGEHDKVSERESHQQAVSLSQPIQLNTREVVYEEEIAFRPTTNRIAQSIKQCNGEISSNYYNIHNNWADLVENGGNKRSSMKRKAKSNHAFFSKNYSNTVAKQKFKRRKTDVGEEVVLQSDNDTKIKIDPSDIKEFDRDQEMSLVHEEANYYHYQASVHSLQSSVLSHQHESIEDIINMKPEDDVFKGFEMIQNELALDSNVQFVSNHPDWMMDSINLSESKPMKMMDRLKDSIHEEINLFRDPHASISIMDNL